MHCWGAVKWCCHSGKHYGDSQIKKKKLKVESLYGPAMSLLGMDATETKAGTGWEPLRVVLFTEA